MAPSLRRTIPATTVGAYVLGSRESTEPAPILMGFHGYGETAEACLEELQRIPGASSFILVGVQALHRFYDRRHEAVVGSWMTRLDREEAISHNGSYVASVLAALGRDARDDGRVVYLGFSQGASMAYRAAARRERRTLGIIALGGDAPRDVVDDPDVGLPPVLIGRGDGDDWYTEERLSGDLDRLRARAARVEVVRFRGGHEWTGAFREAAGAFLRTLVAP
jgi:predicted esterase